MRIQQLTEQPRRVAAVAFGRMNPPTIGHAKLVDAVKSQAGDPYIFLSQSQKPKTDPLSFEQKIGFAKAFFPGVTVGDPEVRTIFDALNKIYAMGYTDLVYVAGSDRVQQFTDLINKYNGQEDFYSFDSIQVVSAGERDPDAEGAEGMSASKMRAAAVAGDFEAFKLGTPKPELAQGMYDAVRTGMGMMESLARIIEVAARLRQLHEVKPLTENVKRAFGIVVEAWSEKYKRSINCDNPRGFSQRAHCAGRKKNEGVNEAFDTKVEWIKELGPSGSTVYATKVGDAYIELTYRPVSKGVYISFTRGGVMSVTGEGSQNKIFGAVINHIKQWAAKNKPEQIMFSAFKPRTGAFGSQDSTRSGLYRKMVQRFANQNGYEYDVEDTGNEDTFILKRQSVAEGLEQDIPDFLYHATYRPLLKSIKQHGLGGDKAQAKWEDSRPGVVYLAIDPNVAESYAETSDVVPDEWLDQIVILKISTNGLENKLQIDKNVLDNQGGDTLEYHGIIPLSHISMYKQGVAEGKKTNKAFVKPQFDVEWEEAARYPEFQKIGKDAWIELAKKGKSVTIKSAKGINNTDAADPDSFKSLEPEKQKRALAQLEKDTVEMPIVAVYSDGYKELIGGNTRLTAMMARDGKATVWAFKVPDEVAKLAENFAEGKSPHKKGTKKYKAHMAAMHAGMNESYKLQLERDDDLLVLHIKDTKTGKRTEVRGKPNYEGDGYDSDDKLHQLLDKIGKAANMSELMNGEVVSINPRHPDGTSARTHADRAFNESGVGRITKQNATKDAPIGSEFANVKKLGLGSGKPKELHAKARKNSDPNTLFNLGLTEGQLNEKGSIGIPLSSGMTVVIAPHRPLKVKKSKKKVKMVGAGEEE